MDEPLSNLDAKLRVQMRAELKLLRARLGVTTVYVTHDQIEAMTLGDRVAVLSPYHGGDDSNLEQCDSPQKLYHEPRNMFVAGFIGSPAMNFVYADLSSTGEGLSAEIVGTELEIVLNTGNAPTYNALTNYAGKRVIVGIRPEFFALRPKKDGGAVQSIGAAQSIKVKVLVSELVGPDAFLHFDFPTPEVGRDLMEVLNDGESTVPDGARFTARVNAEDLPNNNSALELFLDVPRLHFFDEASTARIC
jgi:multiple sugar transport system ATP-binding protein